MKIQCAHIERYRRKKKGNNAMRYSCLFTLKQCRNEFIFCSVPELNKVLGLISMGKKKNILPVRRRPAKVFQLSALRSEKTEYGKNEGRAANARLRSFQFNEWILINSPFNPDLWDTFPISWIQINVYRSVRTRISRNRNPFQFNLFERNKYVNSDSCNKPAILWWKIYKLTNQWRETRKITN